METKIKKQISLLKKHNVTDYNVENEVITIYEDLHLNSLTFADKDFLRGTKINGDLCLYSLTSLTSVNKDFLRETQINGSLWLNSLTFADKDFLRETQINGSLCLNSLTFANKDFLRETQINGALYLYSLTLVNKDFLRETQINGDLWLDSLTVADKDFLRGTQINGSLCLNSLTFADKDFLRETQINGFLCLNSLTVTDKENTLNNVQKIKEGYNKEAGCCFFDGILSKVLSVCEKIGYVIYETPFEFIVQKGKYTAHAKTIKKAIQDVEFKIISEKLKKEPIKEDTEITVKYYRLITGACDLGCRTWLTNNNVPFKIVDNNAVELTPILAKDLLPMLEKSNAYGIDKIKSLITF